MTDIKVSVIIPIYNAADYLVETVDSVINQTHNNIEIILVDDHSTDNSYLLAEQIKDDRILLVKNSKKGACSARNYGFELATGSYIQYLDADDLMSTNKIEAQVGLAKRHGESFIYSCGCLRFNIDINEQVWKPQSIDKDYEDSKSWLLDSWKGKGMGAVHNWLIPRSLIEKAGQWNEELLINQDGEFLSRILLNAIGIRFSNNAMVYYRSGNSNSVSQKNKYSKKKLTSLLKSYILYKNNVEQIDNLKVLKEGLGHVFLTFIYQYYNHFPELIEKAKQEFYSLGYTNTWPVGGENFIKLASVLGFENTLKVKRLFYKMSKEE